MGELGDPVPGELGGAEPDHLLPLCQWGIYTLQKKAAQIFIELSL